MAVMRVRERGRLGLRAPLHDKSLDIVPRLQLLLGEVALVLGRHLDTNGWAAVTLRLGDATKGKDIGQHRHHVLVLVQRDRLERAVIRHPELLARREVVGDVLSLHEG